MAEIRGKQESLFIKEKLANDINKISEKENAWLEENKKSLHVQRELEMKISELTDQKESISVTKEHLTKEKEQLKSQSDSLKDICDVITTHNSDLIRKRDALIHKNDELLNQLESHEEGIVTYISWIGNDNKIYSTLKIPLITTTGSPKYPAPTSWNLEQV